MIKEDQFHEKTADETDGTVLAFYNGRRQFGITKPTSNSYAVFCALELSRQNVPNY